MWVAVAGVTRDWSQPGPSCPGFWQMMQHRFKFANKSRACNSTAGHQRAAPRRRLPAGPGAANLASSPHVLSGPATVSSHGKRSLPGRRCDLPWRSRQRSVVRTGTSPAGWPGPPPDTDGKSGFSQFTRTSQMNNVLETASLFSFVFWEGLQCRLSNHFTGLIEGGSRTSRS